MTIVPAVMSLLGRAAWWLPGWLDRALPRVDVEGEALAGGHHGHDAAVIASSSAPQTADLEPVLRR
jgi:uncharacterized membrane protein YdfJ with MMPL/SSD domain